MLQSPISREMTYGGSTASACWEGGMAGYQEVLRCLAVNDRQFVANELAIDPVPGGISGLDPKIRSLVRIAVLVGNDGSVETFRWTIGDALEAGADADEIVGILLAVAPLIGVARVVASAPKVALALDYDIDAALERLDT
jgi:alkylhydroperoxidase/carboxymuconolactone decarboxylase family protein YurZ